MATSRPQMSPQGAAAFKQAVRSVLMDWPALTLAIENGMGGNDAPAKRDWMCKVVAESMLKDRHMDLMDYLHQLVDTEFDTVVEDGSLEYNVRWITKFYRDCFEGRDQEVLDSITQAAFKKMSVSNTRPQEAPVNMSEDKESSDSDEE